MYFKKKNNLDKKKEKINWYWNNTGHHFFFEKDTYFDKYLSFSKKLMKLDLIFQKK